MSSTSWLKIGSGFVAKMKGGSNEAWAVQKFSGKSIPLPSQWFESNAPGTAVYDPQAPVPQLVSVTSPIAQGPSEATSGDSKYLSGGNFAFLRWTGGHFPDSDPNYWGFKKLEICRVQGGKIVKKLEVASGSPGSQSRPFVHPGKDYPGSGNPIPEGVYAVAPMISQDWFEKGVGTQKIPLDQLPGAPNDRSDLLAHNDPNRLTAPGSIGCVVSVSDGGWEALKAILIGCAYLIVDWEQGYLAQIGVNVESSSPKAPQQNRPVVQADVFKSALAFTLKWEGGSVDNPSDPGGRTNRGITQATYDAWRSSKGLKKQDVFLSSLDEASKIYEERYWEPLGTSNVALEVVNFDTGVMHGINGAVMFVQEALGMKMTGTYDASTRAKVAAADPQKLAEKIIQGRVAYRHERVAQSASQSVFLDGWLARDRSLGSYISSL